MKVSEAFPSKNLKAEDLHGRQVSVTIESYERQEFREDGLKPVLSFVGKDKGFVLNKSNATSIKAIYGDEMDGWIGKKIILFPTTTNYRGEMVQCIRVLPPQAARGGASVSLVAPPATVTAEPIEAIEDGDNIPF